MTSKNESGIPANVANFDQLIEYVMGYGVDFNPTKETIKTNSLLQVATYAKDALAAVQFDVEGSEGLLSRDGAENGRQHVRGHEADPRTSGRMARVFSHSNRSRS